MPEGIAKAINLFVARPVKARGVNLFAELVNIYIGDSMTNKMQGLKLFALAAMACRQTIYFLMRLIVAQ
nr:hypothetical protein [uncultured Glaciecola sp.]